MRVSSHRMHQGRSFCNSPLLSTNASVLVFRIMHASTRTYCLRDLRSVDQTRGIRLS